VFRYYSIFALAVLCLNCGPKKDEDPLLGTYINWIFIKGEPRAMDGRYGTSRLVLKSEGTYEYKTGTTMMINLSRKAKGKFKVVKNTLVLTGSSETVSGDGDLKRTQQGSHNATMKIVDGMLEEAGPLGSLSVWCKPGTRPDRAAP